MEYNWLERNKEKSNNQWEDDTTSWMNVVGRLEIKVGPLKK